jgi:NhaP-type Na+/H+ or K+/H+ antiporter
MEKIQRFFWLCSGVHIELLKKCPTESSKYAGIGATIFFTGVFAALAGGYALYTVFDNVWIASLFGILWGLLIFNLDRYIVSSMRKEGTSMREFRTALPRILLAILISIVIAKPLEMKIFEKEIQSELIMMEQQTYTSQENEVRAR